MNVAFVDIETTGLLAAVHGTWEVAVILHDIPVDGKSQPDREFVWQLPVDLTHADPDALRISRYYERRWRTPPPMPHHEFAEEWFDEAVAGYPDDRFRPGGTPRPEERFVVPVESMAHWATRFASLTADRILVGANPSFDEKRLSMLMRAHGVAPAWHYRPICVEALAVGFIRGWDEAIGESRNPAASTLPWSSTKVSEVLGLPRSAASHTALGDARWVRDLWIKIMEDAV